MRQVRASVGTTRRQLLAALSAASVLRPAPALPQSAGTRLINVHHHFYPKEIIDGWQDYNTRHGQGGLGQRVAQWTPDSSLREMDEGGTAVSMLSLASIPGVWFGRDAGEMR